MSELSKFTLDYDRIVDFLHMRPEVLSVSESSPTLVARVGLLACMGPHVHVEGKPTIKAVPARATLIWAFSCVGPAMVL
jgi:hypothetical protein